MKNAIAIAVLLMILGGIGYTYYLFMQNIRYAMPAKDFEQEINRQLQSLLKEFNDRSYYGDLQVLKQTPFACDDLLLCLSPDIKVGSKDMSISFLNNRIYVNDLSDDRLSLRLESNISTQVHVKNLSEQDRKDIELIESILPNQISCQIVSHTRGKNSTLNKHSSCELSTPSGSYQVNMSSESFNPTYANVTIPTLLLGMARFSDPVNIAKTKIAIQSFGIQIHSKGLQDKIFEIVQRTKLGTLLHRSSYESSLHTTISGTLEAFSDHPALSNYKKTFSNLSYAISDFLLGKAQALKLSIHLQKDKEPYFFNEEEIEEFGYQIGENPRATLKSLLENYDVILSH